MDYSASRTYAQVLLPIVDRPVIERFMHSQREFETLYRKLHATNPSVALWLLSAAEEIAPADAAEKERYASLALGLFYMLYEQALVDRLHDIYAASFSAAHASYNESTEDKTSATDTTNAADGGA